MLTRQSFKGAGHGLGRAAGFLNERRTGTAAQKSVRPMHPGGKAETGRPRPGQGAPEHRAPAGPPQGHTAVPQAAAPAQAAGPPGRPSPLSGQASVPPPPVRSDGQKPFVVHYSFAAAQQGDIVRVEIDAGANVLLVDDAGLAAYQRHGPFHYVGGGYPRGTALIGVPRAGSWHLIIDLAGRPGSLHHHVSITHHDGRPKDAQA